MQFSAIGTKMANTFFSALPKQRFSHSFISLQTQRKLLHTSPALLTVQSGRVKPTRFKNKPVTYEEFFSPPHIGHRKSWNTWNTSSIEGGLRQSECVTEDEFIRKFMAGTFPGLLLSKVIIKRQYNIIRIAALINCRVTPSKLYFLIGFTETMLGYWLHCNIKLEFQSVADETKIIYKNV